MGGAHHVRAHDSVAHANRSSIFILGCAFYIHHLGQSGGWRCVRAKGEQEAAKSVEERVGVHSFCMVVNYGQKPWLVIR